MKRWNRDTEVSPALPTTATWVFTGYLVSNPPDNPGPWHLSRTLAKQNPNVGTKLMLLLEAIIFGWIYITIENWDMIIICVSLRWNPWCGLDKQRKINFLRQNKNIHGWINRPAKLYVSGDHKLCDLHTRDQWEPVLSKTVYLGTSLLLSLRCHFQWHSPRVKVFNYDWVWIFKELIFSDNASSSV